MSRKLWNRLIFSHPGDAVQDGFHATRLVTGRGRNVGLDTPGTRNAPPPAAFPRPAPAFPRLGRPAGPVARAGERADFAARPGLRAGDRRAVAGPGHRARTAPAAGNGRIRDRRPAGPVGGDPAGVAAQSAGRPLRARRLGRRLGRGPRRDHAEPARRRRGRFRGTRRAGGVPAGLRARAGPRRLDADTPAADRDRGRGRRGLDREPAARARRRDEAARHGVLAARRPVARAALAMAARVARPWRPPPVLRSGGT